MADVVESMLSGRPYQPALGVRQTMTGIAAGRGTLFDGRVVNACVGLFEEHRFKFDEAESERLEETIPPMRSLVVVTSPSQTSSSHP